MITPTVPKLCIRQTKTELMQLLRAFAMHPHKCPAVRLDCHRKVQVKPKLRDVLRDGDCKSQAISQIMDLEITSNGGVLV